MRAKCGISLMWYMQAKQTQKKESKKNQNGN